MCDLQSTGHAACFFDSSGSNGGSNAGSNDAHSIPSVGGAHLFLMVFPQPKSFFMPFQGRTGGGGVCFWLTEASKSFKLLTICAEVVDPAEL